jgi:hypothetical protein
VNQKSIALDNVTIEADSEGTAKKVINATSSSYAWIIKYNLFDVSIGYSDRLSDQSHVSGGIGLFILPGTVTTYNNPLHISASL